MIGGERGGHMLALHFTAQDVGWMQYVLLGALLDALVGVGASFKSGKFDLALVANFLVTNVGKVLAPVILLAALAATNGFFQHAFQAACIAAYGAFLGMILAKLGLPVALANAAVQAAKKALAGGQS